MNKRELVKELSEIMNLPQMDCNHFLNCLSQIVTKKLQENEYVKLTHIGQIYVSQKSTRPGRNPKTGEVCPVPARTGIKFKASKFLLKALNGDTSELTDEVE